MKLEKSRDATIFSLIKTNNNDIVLTDNNINYTSGAMRELIDKMNNEDIDSILKELDKNNISYSRKLIDDLQIRYKYLNAN